MASNLNVFSPTICVTHRCNLNCEYCYQTHDDNHEISQTAIKESLDWIFNNKPDGCDSVNIQFIGGEPLLRFDILQFAYNYVHDNYGNTKVHFFATTNGTCLTEPAKRWFYQRKEDFSLGLSIDGQKRIHDINRCKSYDLIDIDFFVKTWPSQGAKMTLSLASLRTLADDVIFLHQLGFKTINGVNLAEGDFDWSDPQLIEVLIPQLYKLSRYYSDNPTVKPCQLFDKKIYLCSYGIKEKRKWCGVGENTVFIDTDGKRYPCSFLSPMTFDSEQLNSIGKIDFKDINRFTDMDCYKNCYLYPICSSCAGANYLNTGTLSTRNKSKCKLLKLLVLFIAEMHTNRILNHRELYTDEAKLYKTIDAIQYINSVYKPEFQELLLKGLV